LTFARPRLGPLTLAAAAVSSVGILSASTPLLPGSYPLEVEVAFHAALLHWVDSLTGISGGGMTAGKTWLAHRREYQLRFGNPDAEDIRWLERYLRARGELARTTDPAERFALTTAFYAAPDLDGAIESAGSRLPDAARADFAGALRHFAPHYRAVWRDGVVVTGFLDRVRRDPHRARRLSGFLSDVARFYGVDPLSTAAPVVLLVPVRDGHGTHAQAVGRWLLVEVRPGEGLREQVAPIVHENAHFLDALVPLTRRQTFAEAAATVGPRGREAWGLLQEALPTAIAQGVADARLGRPGWSLDRPWYHEERIDAYAKRIYPIVLRALDGGVPLDEKLIRELVAAVSTS
jgi:hypothetical protein